MKKFFALMFSLLCVGMIFVGCTKETEKYYSDVYDNWNSNVKAESNAEFYDSSKNFTFSIENWDSLVGEQFKEVDLYQEIFNNVKNDVEKLSFEFVHDPRLEGKNLKNAQKKVTAFKEQLKDYQNCINEFVGSKNSFESICSNASANYGIIEKDEYKAFLNSYRKLIDSALSVFSSMYDCSTSMYFSGKVSGFANNAERVNSIKQYCFESKLLISQNYMYFCHDFTDDTQAQADIKQFYDNYCAVEQIVLSDEKLNSSQSEEKLPKIDAKLEEISIWLGFLKSQSKYLKNEIEQGYFKFDITGIEIVDAKNARIIQNHEKYVDFVSSTMKNLSKSCKDLVAFY